MRTSNKILVGFLIVIFLVPLFILMSFNSKIKKGQYTIVKNKRYESVDFRGGSFKPYKVIKIVAPGSKALKVNLQNSGSMSYNYNITSGDSVRVYNVADTLVVQYISMDAKAEVNNENNIGSHFDSPQVNMELKVPSYEHIILDNAEAVLLISADVKDINAEIVGTGILSIGEAGQGDDDVKNNPVKELHLQNLSVKTSGAQLALGKNINISQLKIEANGPALITINEGAAIGEIQGKLSDSSSVNASWKYVKRLALLTRD